MFYTNNEGLDIYYTNTFQFLFLMVLMWKSFRFIKLHAKLRNYTSFENLGVNCYKIWLLFSYVLIGRNKEKLADWFVYYFEKTMGLKIFGIFIVFPHENKLNKNQFREIISEI